MLPLTSLDGSFNRTFSFLALRLIGGLLLLGGALPGAEVSRQPPAIYGEKAVPLLTPVGTITAPRERSKDDNASGMVLLDERIHIVEPDGRRLVVWHLAYKAFTEAGAKSCGEDVFTYLRDDQKFHLVTAETIQPDGTVLPVRPNAVLVQSPQRQADYALYDDQEEVKIIFPNVKEGSITHVIAAIEDTQVRMPGEYAHDFTWTSSWATGRLNLIVDLPAALAEKLRIHTLGADVPEPTRTEPDAGRARLHWKRAEIPSLRYEVGRAPARQVGPVIQLSTIASWDEVGRWFGGLLAGRDQLSPALAAKVDEWTQGDKTREATIRTLLAKVANDVRYTGLELGQAAYQPHDCNEVWENQYGDCKDKANLLAAFLRHKGIAAHVALVNTSHLGFVDRRSPDYRAFTHAITAIPDGKGGYEFCDPTISFCAPGMIGPGSADRDVLVVTDDSATWVRTPPQKAGGVAYAFELELGADGELSGWMTVTSDGYYGAGQRERYRKRDADETRRRLTDWVRGFFPGAEVMDAVKVNPEAVSGPDTLKAYFIVSAKQDQSDGRRTLKFPHGGWMLPDLGTSTQRDSTYFLYQDKITLSLAIKLPERLGVEVRPEPYRFDTPTGRGSARWEFDGRMARAELDVEIAQPALSAAEFGRFYQAVQSMEAWLEKPVVLAMDSSASAVETKAGAGIDLPLMPTGEGQLALVDKRYPYEGNHALRRAALERTLQYFPNDRNTVFQAQVRLGFLDWAADKNEEALNRVVPLLASHRSAVSRHDFAWAENLQALALRDLKRPDESLAILTRIARDTTLTPFRRSNGLLSAAEMMESAGNVTEAIGLLSEGLELDPDKRTATYQRLVRLLLARDERARTKEILAELVQRHPGDSAVVLAALVGGAVEWSGPGSIERLQELRSIVEKLVPEPAEALAAKLAEAKKHEDVHRSVAVIQTELHRLVAIPPLSAWYQPINDKALKTWTDFEKAIQVAEDASDPFRGTQLAVEALLALPVDDTFSERLEAAIRQAEWLSRQKSVTTMPPILTTLLDLCDRLPEGNSTYYEGRIWRARVLATQGDSKAEQAIYQKLVQVAALPPVFVTAANARLGKSLEKSGDYASALSAYLRLEPHAPEFAQAAESLLRAVFINLHLKKTDEALRIIRVMEALPDAILTKTEGEKQIREFIALAKSGCAVAFWDAHKNWWPRWIALKADQKMEKHSVDEVVPVIDDLMALGRALGEEQRAKNIPGCFQVYQKVVSGARWLPSLGSEVAGLTPTLVALVPGKIKGLYGMVIPMLEIPITAPGIDERGRKIQLAAHLVEDRRASKALTVLAELRSQEQPEDDKYRAMVVVWGYAALADRNQYEACTAALEKVLINPLIKPQRNMMVTLLSSLYRAQGRAREEEMLLQRELSNQLIIDDESGHRALKDRLASLGGSVKLTAQVAAWIKTSGLDWYDYSEPQSLADPGLRNLEEALKNPGNRFTATETIKLQLLVAQDANRTLDAQQSAWNSAISGLLDLSNTREDAIRIVDTIVNDDAAPQGVRSYLLWLGLYEAARQGWANDYARWAKHPLTPQFNARQTRTLPLFSRWARIKPFSTEEETELLLSIARAEMDPMDVLVLQEVAAGLMRRGEVGAVKEVLALAPSWQFTSDVKTSREQLEFDLMRRVRKIEAEAPLHDALSQLVLDAYPKIPDALPKAFAGLRRQRLDELPPGDDEETVRACLYLIKQRGFNRESFEFWSTFLRARHHVKGGEELAFEFCRVALETASDDEHRAQVISMIPSAVDLDKTEVLERLSAWYEPYRDAGDAPATSGQIRLHDIHIALRTATPVDLETAFNGINDPSAGYLKTVLSLRHHLQRTDKVALKRILGGPDSGSMLVPGVVELALPAFELLGLKNEARLAKDLARRELRKRVVYVWATQDVRIAGQAVSLAHALNEEGVLPEPWLRAMEKRTNYPHMRHGLLLTDAWLRRDWATVTVQSNKLIEWLPSYYRFYWYRGYAAHQQGRKAEAIEALTTYVKYSKDEIEYPEAMALLDQLKR